MKCIIDGKEMNEKEASKIIGMSIKELKRFTGELEKEEADTQLLNVGRFGM